VLGIVRQFEAEQNTTGGRSRSVSVFDGLQEGLEFKTRWLWAA